MTDPDPPNTRAHTRTALPAVATACRQAWLCVLPRDAASRVSCACALVSQRKDNLVRNSRRLRATHGPMYDFVPVSFILPNEYTKFATFFADERELLAGRTPSRDGGGGGGPDASPVYICKPTDLSRGRGIFLFRDIADLSYDRPAVVQRYVERPLTVGGYKLDLRIYVLVTSVQPLRAFLFKEGITRFSTEKYDMSDIENAYKHLTNYSINKKSDHYSISKDTIGAGSKWLVSTLMDHLSKHGVDQKLLWTRIENMVLLTIFGLLSVVPKADGAAPPRACCIL